MYIFEYFILLYYYYYLKLISLFRLILSFRSFFVVVVELHCKTVSYDNYLFVYLEQCICVLSDLFAHTNFTFLYLLLIKFSLFFSYFKCDFKYCLCFSYLTFVYLSIYLDVYLKSGSFKNISTLISNTILDCKP